MNLVRSKLETQELFILIGVLIIILDLILTGIIGLIKKEIKGKNILLKLVFLPLGLIGMFMKRLYKKQNDEVEKGNTAISSSIGAIAMGLLLSIFFGFYYASKYKIISSEILNILVPVFLFILIIGVPVVVIILVSKEKK